MISKLIKHFAVCVCLLTCSVCHIARGGVVLIRDSEIEDTLREILDQILEVAGIDKRAVKIYLISDRSVNAFATFEKRIFVCTGLLLKADKVEHIVGVLSHEIGHIACEHMIRHVGAAEQSKILSVALAIVGIGAGMAIGSPDLIMGGMMGGMAMGINTFLYYSRAEEEAADNKAMDYMQKLGLSTKGLLEVIEMFALSARLNIGEKGLPTTHPGIEARVAYLRANVHLFEQTSVPRKIPPETAQKCKRIRIKLEAYSKPVEKTLAKFPRNDCSTEALYARAIALNKRGDFHGSIACMDALISKFPKDPYFLETKAQILYENSRISEAVELYRSLVALKRSDVLLNIAFANALIKSGDNRHLDEAQKVLNNALIEDKSEPLAWYLMSIIYGKRGDYGTSALMSAEGALVRGDERGAIAQAKRAIKYGLKNPIHLQRAKFIAKEKTPKAKGKPKT
ncbi:MAG: M48 family metalloprotease [Holosporales bacterium]|nr:M48 family metalloprotease [Holosporales bacterium]